MAEQNDGFNIVSYYNDLINLFKGGPVFKQRIAAKVAAPGEKTTPVGTARAFMKDTNTMYSNMMSSYRTIQQISSLFSDIKRWNLKPLLPLLLICMQKKHAQRMNTVMLLRLNPKTLKSNQY